MTFCIYHVSICLWNENMTRIIFILTQIKTITVSSVFLKTQLKKSQIISKSERLYISFMHTSYLIKNIWFASTSIFCSEYLPAVPAGQPNYEIGNYSKTFINIHYYDQIKTIFLVETILKELRCYAYLSKVAKRSCLVFFWSFNFLLNNLLISCVFLIQELEDDIASHQVMFNGLNDTGKQILVDLEAGEVKTALQSKLDDMNDRWNSLGVRVVDIRDR